MKTLRFALIAALISLSMMSMAQNNERIQWGESNGIYKMVNLCQVLDNPDFCQAIRTQVSLSNFRSIEPVKPLMVTIIYRDKKVVVRGTYSEWVAFFRNPLERMPSARDLKGNSGME